jgi:3-phenylpropionate/trans-cinnamate dioxygenase ferredoxin component
VSDFIDVGRLEEVPPGKGTTFTVEGKEIAVFNVDGELHAMDDACLHQGMSLGWSRLEGKIVTCRAHGMRYDATTGQVSGSQRMSLKTYPVKVERGRILVSVG